MEMSNGNEYRMVFAISNPGCSQVGHVGSYIGGVYRLYRGCYTGMTNQYLYKGSDYLEDSILGLASEVYSPIFRPGATLVRSYLIGAP